MNVCVLNETFYMFTGSKISVLTYSVFIPHHPNQETNCYVLLCSLSRQPYYSLSKGASETCPSDSVFLTNPRAYLQNAEFSTETTTFKRKKPIGARHFVR